MRLCRFNEMGISTFRESLNGYRHGATGSLPPELLNSADYSEVVGSTDFVPGRHATREALAREVCGLLEDPGLNTSTMSDVGLWAWLGAVYFDSTCPVEPDGRRKPGSDYRHIPTTSFRNFYRHLIRGPVRIYKLFENSPPDALILLCQPPFKPGDFVEQLSARQERVTNPAVIGAATKLYIDAERRVPKRGASPKPRNPGTLRRFIDVLDQLDLTYDLYGMGTNQLIDLLPTEFDRYRI